MGTLKILEPNILVSRGFPLKKSIAINFPYMAIDAICMYPTANQTQHFVLN